jgi:four helix bundle protein
MKGYQKLQVYQLSHELAIRIHAVSLSLPQFERYEEGSQIRRSSKSVSANIVEGFALRKYKNEYLHYLYRSYGSSEETLEHLRYLYDTGSLKDRNVYDDLENAYRRLNGMLFNFIMSIEKTFDKPAFLVSLKRGT